MNYPPIPSIDWWAIAPVSIVSIAGVLALIVEMLWPRRNNNTVATISLLGLVGAGVALAMQYGMTPGSSFAGMVERDNLGVMLQGVIVLSAALCLVFSESYLREKRIPFGEFYPLALWSAAGGMIMVSTESLLMVFLGIETLSIALYCLAGMSRREQRSQEAAIKYFLLGSFATAILLFGAAYIYGATGSLQLDEIRASLESLYPAGVDLGVEAIGALFGVMLVLVGLAFKAALVPFHQWTPDVYQGAPTNVTAFMAAVSKVAAFGALVRFLPAVVSFQDFWLPALAVIAALTMTYGNLVALTQSDVKRALAYSSISHAGYVLVAVISGGLGTTVFYLAVYSLTTVGAFAVVGLTAKDGREGTRFSDLHGLYLRAPFAAGVLVVCIASLIGIPPTAGFVGKLLIFSDALQGGFAWLAVLLAINSAISVYYYLGILRAAFVADEDAMANRSAKQSGGLVLAAAVCAAGVFALSVLVTPIRDSATTDSTFVAPDQPRMIETSYR